MNGSRESGDRCWTFSGVGYSLIGMSISFIALFCFVFHLKFFLLFKFCNRFICFGCSRI